MANPLFKKIFFKSLLLSGWHKKKLSLINDESLVLILNLHKVTPEKHELYPGIHPQVFDDFLTELKKHCVITSFSKFKEVSSSKPRVILSFDDGYADFIKYAVPILRRHHCTANQNVVVECIETGLPPWNICLYDWLIKNPSELPAGKKATAIGKDLKFLPREQREQKLKDMFPQFHPSAVLGKTPMMSLEDIRSLQSDFEIGCHSYSHESMAYQSATFFEEDFKKCQAYFNEKLGQSIGIYAFPNGSHRTENLQYLKNEGIPYTLLVEEKYAKAQSDLFPRFTLYGDSSSELFVRALGYNNAGVL